MITRIVSGITQVAEGLGGIVGIRVGTEEPMYLSEPLSDHVEIRRYGPRIAAETTVFGDDDQARSTGFRRLAGYIFGDNNCGSPEIVEGFLCRFRLGLGFPDLVVGGR